MKTSKTPSENKCIGDFTMLDFGESYLEMYFGKSTGYRFRGCMLYVNYEIWQNGIF